MEGIASFKLKKGKRIGNYQIIKCLGRSCEGEVYRVREEYSGTERALKLFFPFSDFRYVARYAAKLERLKGVKGIIQYYHGGYWEGQDSHFLVLEYSPGKDLGELIKRHPFPVFQALKVARELFRIMATCHEVKRECIGDLDLYNVLFSRDERVTIIDLDSEARYTKACIREDIACVCEIFYELNWNLGPYPRDLRKAIPKGRKAIKGRYRTALQALEAIEELMGNRSP